MDVGVVDPATTRELRRTVLRPDHAPGDALPSDDLPGGVHIGIRDDDGTVLGTCFVFPDPCPWLSAAQDAWHLRQMATARDRRGFTGFGEIFIDPEHPIPRLRMYRELSPPPGSSVQ